MKSDSEQNQWFVYMIETQAGKIYTGISKDVTSRFQKHRNKKGAKFFYGDPPKQLLWTSTAMSHSDALKREIQIKKMKPKEKKMIPHS